MQCQHKYKNCKSICKSPPLRDGFCTLHYKQKEKETRLKKFNGENNNIVDDKNEDAVLSNQNILSNIQTTFRYNNLDILCIKINEYDIWFKAKEAAESMGYKDTSHAIQDHVFEEHKKLLEEILNLGPVKMTGPNNLTHNEKKSIFINEAGLYCLIMSSKKPEAIAFKKYVIETILPSIRRTGNYISNPTNTSQIAKSSNEITYFYDDNDITPFLHLNVVYLGETGEIITKNNKECMVYKLGKSYRAIDRDFKEHKKTFVNFRMILILHCDNNDVVEDYLKIELKAKDMLYDLPKKTKNNENEVENTKIQIEILNPKQVSSKQSVFSETFILTDKFDLNYVMDLMKRLVDEYPLKSIKERDDKIRELECDKELQKMNIELKMKEEETKQKEEETKQKQIEKEQNVELAKIKLEMMKLKYTTKNINKNIGNDDDPDKGINIIDEYNSDSSDESDNELQNEIPDRKTSISVYDKKMKKFKNMLDIYTLDKTGYDDLLNKQKYTKLTSNEKLATQKFDFFGKFFIDFNSNQETIIENYFDWFENEYILDNALYALGKKHYDDSLDPYFSNIGIKIEYLNIILGVFGFRSLLDFDTVVELTDTLRKKMENSKLLDKINYPNIMKIFNKSIQSKDIGGKFEVCKFIKFSNCILNEFGFEINNNEKKTTRQKKSIRFYSYFLMPHANDIINIINKY